MFNCRNFSVLLLAAGIVSLIIKVAYKKSLLSVSGEYRILKSYSDFIILTVFSLAAAFFAVMIQTLTGEIRYNASYLCVPYISALSVYVLWLINKEINLLLIIANIFFTVANIHTVNIYAGIPYLSNYGLSVIHTICLGIFISIIVFSILSKFNSQFFFNLEIFEKFKTSWSGIILFLLTFNYFSNSNLEDFTLRRFLVSGILAYCSGLIFRNAAFKIRETESALFKTYSFFYNFGVLVALWCLFLMIPHLRSPEVVFIALALPVLYFYLRAELGKHFSINKTQYSQYRDTAMIISFILLFFYVNRAVFQMILFPEQNIFTVHYHYHSPVILAISLILLRLRGLGANYWSSFYGGLGFVTALFFLITFIPGLSPFDRIIPGCWIGAAIYHLFVSLTMYENPVGNLLRKISGLNKIDFTEISIVWSRWIAAAVNILTLLGLSNFQSDSYSAAPLLFAGSSIFLHQNYFDKLNFYKIAAAFQILTALHFDFISPSFIKKNYILWIILTAFASIETVHYFFQKTLKTINFYIFAGLFILAGSHIFYLHPASRSGLSGFFILWILTAFIPVKNQTPVSFRTKIISVFLLIAPVWLTFFSLTTLRSDYNLINGICISPQNFFKCKSQFVFSYLTLFCSAIFVQLCYDKWKSFINKIQNGSNPPFFAVSLKWYSSAGNAISSIFGSVIFAALIITGVFYYNSIFEIKSAAAFSGLWLGLSVFWFLKGGNSENYFPYLSAQLCAACFFAFVRRQLTLTYDFWKIEYDVWASLAVSFIIAGVKQLIYRQKRNMRFSFILTLFVMPVFAVIWTMFHRLGVNMTLLVIGLNSMIFCYYGKDEKDSLYNIAAVIGFVVFCMLLLWTKLEIRYLHSFVIPVSSGILALSQIFKKSLARETLAAVRFTGIASIIGCSGYYALIDSSHTAVFNLAMIAACLLIMFAGSFFKIKLYIMTGFSGLIIDAVSIFYKLIIKFDRTYKMTAMGIALLLIGASLVIGAAYYKTNKIR
ncbi:MAG TPA: hypothetical protein PLQ81_08290, partial [bacterium]|nr:hypothetical protein [bacterium]